MAGMSNYLEAALGNAVLRNTTYTSPATVYLSFHSADPGETGASELSGNNYSRVAIAFGAPTDGVFLNSANVDSPVASGAWSAATHFGIWDASTSGNFLTGGALTTARTIGADGFIRVQAGEISITFA